MAIFNLYYAYVPGCIVTSALHMNYKLLQINPGLVFSGSEISRVHKSQEQTGKPVCKRIYSIMYAETIFSAQAISYHD